MSKKNTETLLARPACSSEPVDSSFGKKFLFSQGWIEGDVIGSSGDGLQEPLVAKTHSASLNYYGDETASKSSDEWWITSYNKLANNLSIPKGLNTSSLKDNICSKKINSLDNSIWEASSFELYKLICKNTS